MDSKSRVLSGSDQKRGRKKRIEKKGESFKIVDRTIKDADTYDASRTSRKKKKEIWGKSFAKGWKKSREDTLVVDTQARIVEIVPKDKRRASEGRERDEVVDRAKNEDRRP